MVLPLAIALMAAGGVRKYKQDQQDDADAAEAAQIKREDRAFTLGERARIVKQRDDTAAAAAPTTVDETPVAMPIGSRDEPRPPEDVGIRAAGKTFTNRADADKAAAEYNAEPAVAKRVAGVARMAGDYAGSQQVMNLSRQGQLADMQLDEAQAAHLNKLFDDNLQKLGTHDDIANAISQSTLGGSLKVKPVPSADGKRVEYHRVNEDGSTTPTGQSFPVGDKGVLEAKLVMARLTPVSQKLDYLHKQSEVERTQGNLDRDFTQRKGESDRDYQLRKDEADRRAKHDRAMLANDGARLNLARMAATKDAAGEEPVPATPDSTFDRKTATDIAKDQVQKEADLAREAGKGVMTGAQIAKRVDEIVQAQFDRHAARFDQAAIVKQLWNTQADPAAYAANFEKAQKYGIPLGELAKMGFKPPQRAAPAAQPAAPGAAPAMPAAPAAAAAVPQAAAAPAGAMPPVPFQQFVAQNIATPAGKQAISQRVMKELPEIQFRIKGITDVMALPMVSGAVKAKLKGELDMLAQDAQMMQAFAAGNPGI
jgi:hypothetical protein